MQTAGDRKAYLQKLGAHVEAVCNGRQRAQADAAVAA